MDAKQEANDSSSRDFDWRNHVVAPLIVAAIVGIFSAAWGSYWEHQKNRKRIEAAPQKYVEELDKLIQRGEKEGVENAILNARAIVAARNSLRNSLVAISGKLDSEIDHLAVDIGQGVNQPAGPSTPGANPPSDAKQAYATIQVLVRIWPAKKQEIQVEIRKLLAELGLDAQGAQQDSTLGNTLDWITPALILICVIAAACSLIVDWPSLFRKQNVPKSAKSENGSN